MNERREFIISPDKKYWEKISQYYLQVIGA